MGFDELLALRWGCRYIAAATASTTAPASAPAFRALFIGFLSSPGILSRCTGSGKFCIARFRRNHNGWTALAILSLLGTAAALAAILSAAVLSRVLLSIGVAHFTRWLVAAADRSFFKLVGLFLVFQLHKVGDVEEGVALQPNVDKCRLHAGEHPGDAPVVNGSGQRVLVFAFVIDFRELIVF